MLRLLVLIVWLATVSEGAEEVRRPYPGVTHIVRSDTTPRAFRMHVVRIDLGTAGLRFKVSPPGGQREAVRQTTLDFLISEKAQIAVNLHFFLPFPSSDPNANLIGLAASEGKLYSGFETPEQSYALVANAPAIHVDRDNRAMVMTHENASGAVLWNAFAGSAQIVTDGKASIPVYRDKQHPDGQLIPGGPGPYSNAKSWYAAPNARTIAGLSRDNGTLFVITIDRAGTSMGLSLYEAAEILVRDYAVQNAINLDGGGSTTLAMQDPGTGERAIVNAPSGGTARSVASSLAVFVPLDITPPVTTHTFLEDSGDSGAYRPNLTIELLASDPAPGTGVRQIHVSVAAEHAATVFAYPAHRTAIHLTTPGEYRITYFARDHAGNAESPQSISVRIAR